MKEFDFDELDRAIRSLSTDTSPAITPQSQATPVSSVTEENKDEQETLIQSPPIKPSEAFVPRPNSGRFMDVVHPSLDMKNNPVPLSVRTSNSSLDQNTESSSVNFVNIPNRTMAQSIPQVLNDSQSAIETIENNNEQINEEEKSSPIDNRPPITPLPFIADAKVEKRPLGGGAIPVTVHETKESYNINDIQDLDQENTVKSTINTTIVDNNPVAPEDTEPTSTPIVESAKKEIPQHLLPDRFPDEDTAIGPVSIAQAYREEPSTGDQSNGAIYDTDTYHQPLVHNENNKSKPLVIVLIILTLLIGVAIGVAVCYFTLVK